MLQMEQQYAEMWRQLPEEARHVYGEDYITAHLDLLQVRRHVARLITMPHWSLYDAVYSVLLILSTIVFTHLCIYILLLRLPFILSICCTK